MITDSQSVISVEGRSTALNCCVTSPALFLVANDWILGHHQMWASQLNIITSLIFPSG